MIEFIKLTLNKWIVHFLFLGTTLSSNQETQKLMLNYVEPTYHSSTLPSGLYKIEVDVKIGTDTPPPEKIEKFREEILTQEAEKNSLFAVAFIQKLAADGDSQAIEIRTLYQSYHKYFENLDRNQLLKSCDNLINDKNGNPLSQNFAKIIKAFLENHRIGSSLEEARILLNKLIPGIEQTLTMKPPQKVYEEQKVIISEMFAPYNAFPDLIKHEGAYYATFREGNSHGGYNDFGKIRILKGHFNQKNQLLDMGKCRLALQRGVRFERS